MSNTLGILDNVSLNVKKKKIVLDKKYNAIDTLKVTQRLNENKNKEDLSLDSSCNVLNSFKEDSLPPPPNTIDDDLSTSQITNLVRLSTPNKDDYSIDLSTERSNNIDYYLKKGHNTGEHDTSASINLSTRDYSQRNISKDFSDSILVGKSSIALYIGDLGKDVTEGMLNSIFNSYNSFVSAKICIDSKTGESLGYGYLNLSNREEAYSLLERYNYTNIFGREVRIMPSLRNSTMRKQIGTNIYLAGLSLKKKGITTRIFYDYFKIYGKILSCKLNFEKDIGFIFFENKSIANKVIEIYNDKTLFFGNKIKCNVHLDKEERGKTSLINNQSINLKLNSANNASNDDKQVTPQHKLTKIATTVKVNEINKREILIKIFSDCVDEEKLLVIFKKFGKIHSVTKLLSSKHGKKKTHQIYILKFDTKVNLKKVISKTNNTVIGDNKIKVSFAKTALDPLQEIGHKPSKKNKKKNIVYLSNLSSICTIEFLKQFCFLKNIRQETIKLNNSQNNDSSLNASVLCKTKNDAKKLFNCLNDRLIGGSQIKTSWHDMSKSVLPKLPNKNGLDANFKTEHSLKNVSSSHDKTSYNNIIAARENKFILSSQNFSMMRKINQSYIPISSGTFNDGSLNLAFQNINKNEVLQMLKKQVNKGLDFIKYPTATRDINISCISEYIFEVFWNKNATKLWNFLMTISMNTYNESFLQNQIEAAADTLGFRR
ncbi:hypothetical protein TPHA_0A02220 [Tetrapisispora phaffii CBS 4417]|uniref:RRM domain-containing protein n=1 Tax=Tetrapisispora phaffii (strain ATCC 24235 / CBS 4417 / NBRC 1672 / NRRL Y-8282 / UCD 70-5) TaxID=1071381 RepID=G8BN26_TETPH|nr:hypothetical protein TPHA_0A02220 [Tetrapisispora phaffii CBS 4417]CCE61304.1 hypothetical protein TPHA_0A02220 [Tetrapisispora phaffii CBS 4417]